MGWKRPSQVWERETGVSRAHGPSARPSPAHARGVRAFRPLPVAVVVSCLLLAAIAGALSGCAGELPVHGQTSSTSIAQSTTTTLSPAAQLSDQIAATWSEAVQKLVPLIEGTPPFATLQAPVEQLKEEYLQKMVTLGRQVQALDEGQRQTVYDRATDLLAATANTDWFQSYVRLYNSYSAGSGQDAQDFAILLSTFNTLTQYAFFDLLKEQDPDEAARLGIQ